LFLYHVKLCQNQNKAQPDCPEAEKPEAEKRDCHTGVETQECGSEEFSLSQIFPSLLFCLFLCHKIVREGQNGLLHIVCGKNRRTGISVSSFEHTPLERHGEEDRVYCQNRIHILREKSQYGNCCRFKQNHQVFQVQRCLPPKRGKEHH